MPPLSFKCLRKSRGCSKKRSKDFHYSLLKKKKLRSEWEHFVLQDVKIHVFISNGGHLFERFLISAKIIWLLLFFWGFLCFTSTASAPLSNAIETFASPALHAATSPQRHQAAPGAQRSITGMPVIRPHGYKQVKCNIKDVTSMHCRKTAIMYYYNNNKLSSVFPPIISRGSV